MKGNKPDVSRQMGCRVKREAFISHSKESKSHKGKQWGHKGGNRG